MAEARESMDDPDKKSCKSILPYSTRMHMFVIIGMYLGIISACRMGVFVDMGI